MIFFLWLSGAIFTMGVLTSMKAEEPEGDQESIWWVIFTSITVWPFSLGIILGLLIADSGKPKGRRE